MTADDSSTGTGTRPRHKIKGFDQSQRSACPPSVEEIRILQERLSYLEVQAAQHWKATVEDVSSGDARSVEDSNILDSGDDDAMRRRFRKASSNRRWIEKVEQQAEEEADRRKEYGQEPNKVELLRANRTMYHVRPDGDLAHGTDDQAMFVPGGWADTHAPMPYSWFEELHMRRSHKPFPHRGIRLPTAMHHFYGDGKPDRRLRDEALWPPQPPGQSRKLGPPTRWDESDSGEWSSDTSTRSQDFKYFRSRLRGDFEWELDRLNAQVLRFKNHQSKKKARQVAIEAQEDNEKRNNYFGAYKQRDPTMVQVDLDAEAPERDKHGLRRQLNLLGWTVFKLSRAAPLQYSCVIDVLIEEPKVSSDLDPWGRMERYGKDKKTHKQVVNFQVPEREKMESKDGTEQNSKQSAPWTPREPLPERIRINSRPILDVLSSIHGSPLCPYVAPSSSVVLLRPFRVLSIYDKQIRDTCVRLRAETGTESAKSATQGEEVRKKQTKTNIGPDEESAKESVDANDKTKPLLEEDKIVSGDEISSKGEHLSCLCEFMDEYIGRKIAYLNSVGCSKIFFSDVWHLFQPGTTVISADGKQAYRVVSIKSKRHKGADRWAAFRARQHGKKRRGSDSSDSQVDDTRNDITIKCVFIHFDGDIFGPVLKTYSINKWDGEKEVTYLDIYPLRFHILKNLDKRSVTSSTKTRTQIRGKELEEGMEALRKRLVDRGRVFVDVAAVKQMYYSGPAVDTRDEIESQVMVDFEESLAQETSRNWTPNITRLVGTDWDSKTDEDDEGCTAECCWHENVHMDAYVDTNKTEKFIDDMMAEIEDTPQKLPAVTIFPRSLEETKTESNALTEDELMIMSYSVFGFVLRDRTWGKRLPFSIFHSSEMNMK